VQLIGKFAQESDLLTFAEELESMPGLGFQRPPDMEVDD
jgi:Asp-tRNA(Asn)/Glu-tRNA(Gln) amidotransferase A subunit family amidase